MKLNFKGLAVTLIILLVPSAILTFVVGRSLSYGPFAETDANMAQTEIIQKIKRITDLGDRFGITTDVLAFTFRFQASTTVVTALSVQHLGKEFFAPVNLTLSEIKYCTPFVPSDTQDIRLLLTKCSGKYNNVHVDNKDYSILELLGRENIIMDFYPDSLSIAIIFAIIYLFCGTFLIIFFKIWKSVREIMLID